jgi:LmbE family N-acetylglucosaminyl deacetylase
MKFDALVVAAHPDDAESQMGGTLAKLSARGQKILLVDLSDGEPTDFAERGVRAAQAAEAARILGVERMCLDMQDRLIADTPEARIEVARLIRVHQPRWVYGTGEACVHPDHAAAAGIVRAAVFLARLRNWGQVPGGEQLAGQEAWAIDRLFFPHCKMEPAWADSAFAVDVSDVYDRKRAALACYKSIFSTDDRLLALYEAEDQYYGRMAGVAHAEIFKSASLLVVNDPTVFAPSIHG